MTKFGHINYFADWAGKAPAFGASIIPGIAQVGVEFTKGDLTAARTCVGRKT
jgi:hypothetical protein